MSRRKASAEVDVTAWQEFDANAMPASHRLIFKSLRQAVELYAAQIAVALPIVGEDWCRMCA